MWTFQLTLASEQPTPSPGDPGELPPGAPGMISPIANETTPINETTPNDKLPPTPKKGLSGGAIAGITIGVLAAIVVIIIAVVMAIEPIRKAVIPFFTPNWDKLDAEMKSP